MKYILALMLLASFLVLSMTIQISVSDKVQSHDVFLLFQVLVPTIFLTIMYCITSKHEASVGLYGPILLGSYAITLYTITAFNLIEINSIARNYELYVSLCYYMLYIGFLSIDFLPHFIARLLLYVVIRIHVGYYRV